MKNLIKRLRHRATVLAIIIEVDRRAKENATIGCYNRAAEDREIIRMLRNEKK